MLGIGFALLIIGGIAMLGAGIVALARRESDPRRSRRWMTASVLGAVLSVTGGVLVLVS
jgi:hypothetical protein